MKLYEYRIIFNPKNTTKVKREAKVLKSGEMLASDVKEVNVLCAREIPKEFLKNLSEVEIAVRPF